MLILTARLPCADPDAFDITRKTGGPAGDPFAPSWSLLMPALKERRRADDLRSLAAAEREDAMSLLCSPETRRRWAESAAAHEADAQRIEDAMWAAYVVDFTAEMRASYRLKRHAWDALLKRPRVVLCCYCADTPVGTSLLHGAPAPYPLHCHRVLVASLLVRAAAAANIQVEYGGELPTGSKS